MKAIIAGDYVNMAVDQITAILDFYAIIGACVTALRGPIGLRGGKNAYEIGKNEKAKKWNFIWMSFFWGTIVTAALSYALKTHIISW